jgi:hypothetical protein
MRTSDAIESIAKAMCEAQRLMKPAIKDSVNPHFKSKYSDISSVWESIRDPLTSQGLTVWQDVTTEDGLVCITTRVVHSSGQWVEFGPLNIPLTKKDAHGVGSSVSYGKRYALCAALGVVSGDEDDDGNGSKAPPPQQVKINRDMIIELNTLLDDCGDDYSNQIMATLKSFNPPIRSFEDLPIQLYDRIKAAAIKEKENKQVKNESV